MIATNDDKDTSSHRLANYYFGFVSSSCILRCFVVLPCCRMHFSIFLQKCIFYFCRLCVVHGIFRNSFWFLVWPCTRSHREKHATKDQHIAVDDAANGTQQTNKPHSTIFRPTKLKITQKEINELIKAFFIKSTRTNIKWWILYEICCHELLQKRVYAVAAHVLKAAEWLYANTNTQKKIKSNK